MKQFKNILWCLIIAIQLLATVFIFFYNRKSPVIISTKVVTDTLRDTIPVPYKVIVKGKQIAKLPLAHPDTVHSVDSVLVEVPISQKTYQDSSYRAVVSGYKVSLDSISVYRKTIYETKIVAKLKERNRWNIGLQSGYGMTSKGFTPYVGFGVTINLFK